MSGRRSGAPGRPARRNLAARLLGWMGWTVSITVPDYPKALICVAPHTSNLDFLLGKLAYWAVGRKAGFLMKETWFFWPLGPLLRAIGGIAVPRGRKGSGRSLTHTIIEMYRSRPTLVLAITPEGTRSATDRWHTGFLRIAREADVPLLLGIIDYASRSIIIHRRFEPTGDLEADMRAVKQFYAPYTGRHPEKFSCNP